MTNMHAYEKFLEDPIVYDATQMMWQDLLDGFSLKYGFSFRPYINVYLTDGEKERDGNPIFTALVADQNRGIRLLQTTSDEAQEIYVSGYLDTFESNDLEASFDELVIDLVLSEITRSIAEGWIKSWLVDKASKEDMIRLIKSKMVLVT